MSSTQSEMYMTKAGCNFFIAASVYEDILVKLTILVCKI